MTDYIKEIDARIAREKHEMTQTYLSNARNLDPDKYPSDIPWRDHFVKTARELWRSYLFYRKVSQ